MAQLKVDYRFQVLDVDAARGNVSCHQDGTTLVGESQQYLITVALFQITVQGKGTETFFLQCVCNCLALQFGVAKNHTRGRMIMTQ